MAFPSLRYTANDYDSARRKWGANCGPAALAAVLGKTLDEALTLLPDFKKVGGTTEHMMEQALTLAGRKWSARRCMRPSHGLAIIRVDGPWPQDEAPSHWIGTTANNRGRFVFDDWSIKQGGWLAVEKWGTKVFPRLAESCPGSTGKCWISYGIEVSRL